MTNNKLVSVVMSAYNSEATINESIDSILDQSYKNLEFLIMDDGSTDNTYEKIKEYKNINVFQNKINLGLTKSLNFLIAQTKGEYIARQDADDVSQLNRIKKQITLMERFDLDFCSTRSLTHPGNKNRPGFTFYLPKRLVMKFKNPFIHGTLLIKKNIFEEVGFYNEKFYYSQDYKLMNELLSKRYKYKVLKEPLYNLNIENNISQNKKTEQKYYADCVKKNIEPKVN